MPSYAVYILASARNGTLYVGMTRDLDARLAQHRSGTGSRFTAKHGVMRLVWFERHDDVEAAIARERSIKRWRREWKLALIEAGNPRWEELSVN